MSKILLTVYKDNTHEETTQAIQFLNSFGREVEIVNSPKKHPKRKENFGRFIREEKKYEW